MGKQVSVLQIFPNPIQHRILSAEVMKSRMLPLTRSGDVSRIGTYWFGNVD